MSAPRSIVYAIRPTGEPDKLSLDVLWQQDGDGPLKPGYSHLLALQTGARLVLIAVDGASHLASAFTIDSSGTGPKPVQSHLNIGGPWDIIEPLLIGNQPHLLTYVARSGQFAFHPIGSDLSTLPAYQFRRNHAPGVTAGFTIAQPIVVRGLVYFICYDFDSGRVLIYSLSVTAQSDGRTAPLLAVTTWEHQWAAKWTRFAFFRLGGGPYFLKTNVGRLNVNIDKVLDNPADGTAEVGTNLILENALQLDLVESFYLGGAEPYFLTYMKNGAVTLNRIRSDCLGWTLQVRTTGLIGATHIVPFQLDGDCHVLFY